MAMKLRFDVRDVPSCARLGLSGRKMWIFTKAILASWLAWSASTYLGWLAADPGGLGGVWASSRLLPLPSGIFWRSWPSVALMAAGLLLAGWSLLRAMLMSSRITFEQIRGDDFYSGRDARRFLGSHWRPLFWTPAAIVAGMAVAAAAGLLLGLAGRIPVAGPVIVGLAAVPAWGAALLAVPAAGALLLCAGFLPAIVACTRGDTFESLFELFSAVTGQTARLAGYMLVSLLVRVPAAALFLVCSSAAAGMAARVVGAGMGTAPFGPFVSGLGILAPAAVGAFSRPADVLGLVPQAPAGGAAEAVMAASGVMAVLVLASYWLSAASSGWTLIYLAIRHRRDGEDLVRRADDEDYREFSRQYGSADEHSRSAGAPGGAREQVDAGD
jgi:hypothetical protein